VWVIRLPNQQFRIIAAGLFTLPRDAVGRIDVQSTTQRIRDVVER